MNVGDLLPIVCAAVAGVGAWLLVAPRRRRERQHRSAIAAWLIQAGLPDVGPAEFVGACTVCAFVGAGVGFGLFGAPLPTAMLACCSAVAPVATFRQRRRRRIIVAQEHWPRMIEEIRVLTGSIGRSVPQALFDVGRSGPVELRDAFVASHREWLLTTDFERTIEALKDRLADPTADATLETLVIAHQLGGSSLDLRLQALALDRADDVHSRKDAVARQAGVRFARRFVLIVPAGMAVAGLQIGNGRAAYQTPTGQLAVAAGLALVGLCWVWAGQLMQIPQATRVFAGRPHHATAPGRTR